nr:plant PDR ABC transporter associated [Tanacetum cinerariifolium]
MKQGKARNSELLHCDASSMYVYGSLLVDAMKGRGGGSSKLGDLLGYHGWWQNEGDDEKVSISNGGSKHDNMLMNRPLDVVDEDHVMLLRKLREKIDR